MKQNDCHFKVQRLTNLDERHGLQNIGQHNRCDKCGPTNCPVPTPLSVRYKHHWCTVLLHENNLYS